MNILVFKYHLIEIPIYNVYHMSLEFKKKNKTVKITDICTKYIQHVLVPLWKPDISSFKNWKHVNLQLSDASSYTIFCFVISWLDLASIFKQSTGTFFKSSIMGTIKGSWSWKITCNCYTIFCHTSKKCYWS